MTADCERSRTWHRLRAPIQGVLSYLRRAHSILLFALASGSCASLQAAEIYKCIGPEGRPLYTSEKRDTVGKKCKVISREINVVPLPAPKSTPQPPPQGSFPREDPAGREAAKGRQRQILEKELEAEEELLSKARAALLEQETVRSGNERNYARMLERLRPYQEDVEAHERNVGALRRELQNLVR